MFEDCTKVAIVKVGCFKVKDILKDAWSDASSRWKVGWFFPSSLLLLDLI